MKYLFYIKLLILRVIWFFSKLFKKNFKKTNVDLVIVSHEKDYETLKKTIHLNILNLNHQINKIYIIGSTKYKINISNLKYTYIFEDDLDIVKKNKNKIISRHKGWIIQQLIKLNMDKFSKKYICIDSDTLLLNRISFTEKNQYPIFYLSNELGRPYKNFEKSIGIKTNIFKVYITHMMFFEKFALVQLKEHIKYITKKNWDDFIVEFTNQNQMSFSEYNTYANFYRNRFPSKNGYLYNKTLPIKKLDNINKILLKYKCDSVSFHNNEFRK